ncbi:MAG: L-histidine N(alpha)-methyltransferase [Myxococcota bacterium]
MAKPQKPASQVMELLLHVAERMGFGSDRQLAELVGVTPENVANWRSGLVKELKGQTLQLVKEALGNQLKSLLEQARVMADAPLEVCPLEVEDGSSPADLQRQFIDRVAYDYLGHRFLYYEPQGALAWENLIRQGYEQEVWLAAVEKCARAWLDTARDGQGDCKGPLAEALGLSRKGAPRGIDVIGLGSGEGAKEALLLRALLEVEKSSGQRLSWLTFAPIDVSIPLLLTAARSARQLLAGARGPLDAAKAVLPFCADFEEGRLSFLQRLPTTSRPPEQGIRLVVLLGNTFGNLRSEESFLRHKLVQLVRPGDFVWLEVGVRSSRVEDDPLYAMTKSDGGEETSAVANRRILLEGPYRRWESAMGRRPGALSLRVWVRQNDDSCHVPGSLNFCHDLVLREDRRVCTMLYSRRYDLDELSRWLERMQLSIERRYRIEDSRQQVAHLLLRRR